MELRAEIIPIVELREGDKEEMFALMEQYYAGMRRDVFEADMSEKRWIIELLDADTGKIRGFSTQMILEMAVGQKPIRALFSGDTIVDRSCWGQTVLAQAWGRLASTLIGENPTGKLF